MPVEVNGAGPVSVGDAAASLLPGSKPLPLAVASRPSTAAAGEAGAEGSQEAAAAESSISPPATPDAAPAATETAPAPAARDTVSRVLCCGVEVPLDTPLAWMHSAMSGPDGFVYLVVEAR